jgi:pimeloyl-ACP methyl ester carboxylesterase
MSKKKIIKYLESNCGIKLELQVYDVKKPSKYCLFIHGLSHCAEHFDLLIKEINDENILCFSLSLRSHGKSYTNYNYNTIEDYVNDLKCAVNYIFNNYKQIPFLIGHSLGTLIIQEYIYKYNKKIPGIVLLAPLGITYSQMFLFHKNLPYNMYKLMIYILLKINTDKLINDKYIVKQLFFNEFSDDNIINDCIKILKHERLSSYSMFFLNKNIIKYNFPIYMISGKYDVLMPPSYVDKIYKDYKIKGNNVYHIILENSGHNLMLDNDYKLLSKYINEYVYLN